MLELSAWCQQVAHIYLIDRPTPEQLCDLGPNNDASGIRGAAAYICSV